MKSMIAGSIAIILGIVCLAFFPSAFFSFAAGAIPVLLILAGSLVIYLNYDNVSEKFRSNPVDVLGDRKPDKTDVSPTSSTDSSEEDTIETPDTKAVFRGNTKTMIFHTSDCRFAKCSTCTAKFTTAKEASEEGYKPCGVCKPE